MHYQIESNLVKITKGLADILDGTKKIYVESPFTDDDKVISIVDKDFEVE